MQDKPIIDEMHADDWPAVRRIYEQGIATCQATFETKTPSWQDWHAGHFSHCRLIARIDGDIVGWAALAPTSRRACYAGVAEVSIYIAKLHRMRGIGRALLQAIVPSSERHGIWTLTAGLFPENQASVRLLESCGFRLVGRRERIGQLDGKWRDTVIYERRSAIVGK
jgi:phosphinothricin acetyltransferase